MLKKDPGTLAEHESSSRFSKEGAQEQENFKTKKPQKISTYLNITFSLGHCSSSGMQMAVSQFREEQERSKIQKMWLRGNTVLVLKD